jgi:hypothetical protein
MFVELTFILAFVPRRLTTSPPVRRLTMSPPSQSKVRRQPAQWAPPAPTEADLLHLATLKAQVDAGALGMRTRAQKSSNGNRRMLEQQHGAPGMLEQQYAAGGLQQQLGLNHLCGMPGSAQAGYARSIDEALLFPSSHTQSRDGQLGWADAPLLRSGPELPSSRNHESAVTQQQMAAMWKHSEALGFSSGLTSNSSSVTQMAAMWQPCEAWRRAAQEATAQCEAWRRAAQEATARAERAEELCENYRCIYM